MSYCPLMMAANGLNLGDGPDAKSLNKSRECRADCAWRIGDDCAMVVLARAAQKQADSACVLEVAETDDHRSCFNCHHQDNDTTANPCASCVAYGNWRPRA